MLEPRIRARPRRRARWKRTLLAAYMAATVDAQTILGNPSLSRFNLTSSNTASFQLPIAAVSARGQKTAYSITLNVCSPPSLSASLSSLDSQPVLFVTTAGLPSRAAPPASATAQSIARGGFANVTLSISNGGASSGVFIGVTAPDQPIGVWTFELGATTGSALHVLDAFPLLSLDDTDASTALLTSPTFFPSLASGTPDHRILAMATSASVVPPQLSRSSCFLRTSNATVGTGNPFVAASLMNVSTTSRGVVTLSAREGAVGLAKQQNLAGGLRTQYLLGGLARATNYSVWGLDLPSSTAGIAPVRLYQPQYFRTKSSVSFQAGQSDANDIEATSCRLISAMAECPNVAYSVPAPESLPTADLQALYAAQLAPQLSAFNVSLSTFSCNSSTFGSYSILRSCDDCLRSYTDWLCATTLPRCDDVPVAQLASANAEAAQAVANPVLYNASQVVFDYDPIPSGIQTTLIRSNASVSRTPWLARDALTALVASNSSLPPAIANQSPIPYSEIPPCSSLCYLVAASCPPFIGWQCPLVGKTLPASYGALRILSDSSTSGGNAGQVINGGGSAKGYGRPDDRFGNAFCNALGSDVLLAKRASDARALAPVRTLFVLIVSFAVVHLFL